MSFFEFPHTRTYDSDLGWLIKQCRTYGEAIDALNAWKSEIEPELNDYKQLYDMIMAGTLPQAVQDGINAWMQLHAIDIVGELVKMVFFGITDDGYFVAYIPEGWDDIIFNTSGFDINTPDLDFGHLILSFNVGG